MAISSESKPLLGVEDPPRQYMELSCSNIFTELDEKPVPPDRVILEGAFLNGINGIYDLAKPERWVNGRPVWSRWTGEEVLMWSPHGYIMWEPGRWVIKDGTGMVVFATVENCNAEKRFPHEMDVSAWRLVAGSITHLLEDSLVGDPGVEQKIVLPPRVVLPEECPWMVFIVNNNYSEDEKVNDDVAEGQNCLERLAINTGVLGQVSAEITAIETGEALQAWAADLLHRWLRDENCLTGYSETLQVRIAELQKRVASVDAESSRARTAQLFEAFSEKGMDGHSHLETFEDMLRPVKYWIAEGEGKPRSPGSAWGRWYPCFPELGNNEMKPYKLIGRCKWPRGCLDDDSFERYDELVKEDNCDDVDEGYFGRLNALSAVIESIKKRNPLMTELPPDLKLQMLLSRLIEKGLLVQLGISPDEDQVFIRVRARRSTLARLAQRLSYAVPTYTFGPIAGASLKYDRRREYQELSGWIDVEGRRTDISISLDGMIAGWWWLGSDRTAVVQKWRAAGEWMQGSFTVVLRDGEEDGFPDKMVLAGTIGSTISGTIYSRNGSGVGNFHLIPGFKSVCYRFSGPQQQRLLQRLIHTPHDFGGCGIPVKQLPVTIQAFFPLHSKRTARHLKLNEWGSMSKGWNQFFFDFFYYWRIPALSPVNLGVSSYFGEKVALYFLWIQCYTRALLLPALTGLIVGIYQEVRHEDPKGSIPTVVFVVILMSWSVCWLVYWERIEKEFSCLHGMESEFSQEMIRDSFRGTENAVTIRTLDFSYPLQAFPRVEKRGGDEETGATPTVNLCEVAYPWWKRSLTFTLITIPTICALIALFMYILVVLTDWRFNHEDNSTVTTVASFLVTVEMTIFAYIFEYIARGLNWLENYRTDTDYENALIQKTFMYQFVNAYSGLFILAFWGNSELDEMTRTERNDTRMTQIRSQLLMILVVKPALQNLMEMLFPWLRSWRNKRTDLKTKASAVGVADDVVRSVRKGMNTAQKSDLSERKGFLMKVQSLFAPGLKNKDGSVRNEWMFQEPYHSQRPFRDYIVWTQSSKDSYQTPVGDYTEIALQYGFMSMFACLFPWGPAAAVAYNLVESKLDATKIYTQVQRPVAAIAKDIGAWKTIFTFLTFCSCITNAYAICFMTDVLQRHFSLGDDNDSRMKVFLASQYGLFLVVLLVRGLVPHVPYTVLRWKAREEWSADRFRAMGNRLHSYEELYEKKAGTTKSLVLLAQESDKGARYDHNDSWW
eukprot:Sspe_Gene.14724::Locus_5101_Transcript_1_3_Confidence_0.500_Length_3939::g.14724::m.14724